jgi:hypothetical protein
VLPGAEEIDVTDHPRNLNSVRQDDVYGYVDYTDVVAVTHDGRTTTPKTVGDHDWWGWSADWFQMPTDLAAGDYQVSVTRTYTRNLFGLVLTDERSGYVDYENPLPGETTTYTDHYTYTVRIF